MKQNISILLMLVAVVVAASYPHAVSAGANGPRASPSDCTSSEIVQVVPLVEAVEEQPSNGGADHTFAHARELLTYEAGQQVLLASSPDGTGSLQTDDRVQLRVATPDNAWEHDFRDAERTQIVPIVPQDVTALFSPGVNLVELEVQDLMEPVFSTHPYYLVVRTCVPVTTDTPTVGIRPTATAAPTSTPIPTATASPIATTTPSPTATATPTQTAVPPAVPPPPESAGVPWWPLVGVLAFTGIGGWWLTQQRPRPEGTLDLYEDEVHMDTIALDATRRSTLSIGQNGDIALPRLETNLPVAKIRAERLKDGRVRSLLTHTAPGLPPAAQQAMPLYHGQQLTFGPYRLVYHNYLDAILEENNE